MLISKHYILKKLFFKTIFFNLHVHEQSIRTTDIVFPGITFINGLFLINISHFPIVSEIAKAINLVPLNVF